MQLRFARIHLADRVFTGSSLDFTGMKQRTCATHELIMWTLPWRACGTQYL